MPRPIRSNRFDCPYKTAARCAQWQGWRFERGVQHMDGRRALVYSRIRHNLLNPAETDFDRARRQQQVVAATLDKVTSAGTALRLPFVGGDLVRPLATDLSAWELMQLGWVYFRADTGRALHCRLGGDPATVGGESVILGTEDNVSTVAMFTDRSAPLPRRAGSRTLPGCLVGDCRPYASDFEESDFFVSAVAARLRPSPAAPSLERRAASRRPSPAAFREPRP